MFRGHHDFHHTFADVAGDAQEIQARSHATGGRGGHVLRVEIFSDAGFVLSVHTYAFMYAVKFRERSNLCSVHGICPRTGD